MRRCQTAFRALFCFAPALLLCAVALLGSPAAYAGSWLFRVTGSGSASANGPNNFHHTQPAWSPPADASGGTSFTGIGDGTGGNGNVSAVADITANISATWVPADPNNPQNDPAPPSVCIEETSGAQGYGQNGDGTATVGTANDALGDTMDATGHTQTPSGFPHLSQLTVSSGTITLPTRTFHASASGTGGQGYFSNGSYHPNVGQCNCGVGPYSVRVVDFPLHVNQDQQVYSPAPTISFSATLSNVGNYTIDWIKISVDNAAPMTGTIAPNTTTGTINWDSSQATNPSEHTVQATAQIHDHYGTTATFDSTWKANDGRQADDIIANLQVKSFDYLDVYTLRKYASASPAPPAASDPALVPEPQFVWDQSGTPTTSVAAGDIQGQKSNFVIALHPLNGTAIMGFKLKVQAQSNTINAQTNQPDAALTLYDNTTGDPTIMPTGGYGSVMQTALLPKVAKYSTTMTLTLWVKFTYVTPVPVWRQVGTTYSFGNALYAVLATPTAPMDSPWVGVLDKACDWAKGTADATSAATALTKGFYNNATYRPDAIWYTENASPETFHLKNFLDETANAINHGNGLQGQCNDFSDFLSCLNTAIGAKNLQSQKSNSGFYYSNVSFAPVSTLHTPSPDYFNYHQWTTDGTTSSGNIYDSAIRFGGTTTPANMALADYLSALTTQAISGLSPFTPHIAN